MLNVPMRLTLMMRAKSASECAPSRPTMRLAMATPAQLTSTRGAPSSFSMAAKVASPDAASETSQMKAPPPSSPATIFARASSRSMMATRAPAAASARAVASPRPEAPPVMAAT